MIVEDDFLSDVEYKVFFLWWHYRRPWLSIWPYYWYWKRNWRRNQKHRWGNWKKTVQPKKNQCTDKQPVRLPENNTILFTNDEVLGKDGFRCKSATKLHEPSRTQSRNIVNVKHEPSAYCRSVIQPSKWFNLFLFCFQMMFGTLS